MTLLVVLVAGTVVVGVAAMIAGLFGNYGLLKLCGLAFIGLLTIAVMLYARYIISWFSTGMPDITPLGPSDGGR